MPLISKAAVVDYFLINTEKFLEKQREIYKSLNSLDLDFSRLVFVSPHPDDETIACSGLIQRALKEKIEFKVILISSGGSKKILLGRKSSRINEFQKALNIYGVKNADAFMLDYKDSRILKAVENLKKDLKELFAFLLTPRTIVVFPSKFDLNKDHMAVHKAVASILPDFRFLGALQYLIHYRNFPRPYIFAPEHFLVPPEKLLYEKWVKLPLNKKEREIKYLATKNYRSQMKLPFLKRLLLAFVRKNELFHF
jgi:LmbE family N-acetylglucosaminyl deacetylase